MAKTKVSIASSNQVWVPAQPGINRMRFTDDKGNWIEASVGKNGIEIRGLAPLMIILNVANNFTVKTRPDWSKS